MQLCEGGQSWCQPVSRRHLMAAGVASIPGMSIGRPGSSASFEDMTFLGIFRSLFRSYVIFGCGLGVLTWGFFVLRVLRAAPFVATAVTFGRG